MPLKCSQPWSSYYPNAYRTEKQLYGFVFEWVQQAILSLEKVFMPIKKKNKMLLLSF